MDVLKLFNISDVMNLLSGSFMKVIEKYLMIVAVPVLVIALINCFLGHKVFKILVGMAGLAIGAAIGAIGIIAFSMVTTEKMPAVGMIVLATIIGAAIVGLASFKLYKAGAFCMGFITGVILGIAVMKFMKQDEYLIASVIGGLLMGLLAIDLYRHVVILLTSINGGIVSAACLAVITKTQDPLFILKYGIILSILGIIVQYILLYLSNKKAKEEGEEEPEEEIENKKGNRDRSSARKKRSKKKASKREKKKKDSSHKKEKSKQREEEYEPEFFLIEIFSNIAQWLKDFVEDKFLGEEEVLPPKQESSLKQMKEEVNIPVFDLDDIGHKLEEELEHNLEEDKDKELEDLIIKEAYKNID